MLSSYLFKSRSGHDKMFRKPWKVGKSLEEDQDEFVAHGYQVVYVRHL